KGDEKNKSVKALVKVLQSDDVKKFIDDKYNGAVVPVN
ncbi:MetQ/NlpA family ABC transporter substrate-binding protein, partial [Enterococcus cecorum]